MSASTSAKAIPLPFLGTCSPLAPYTRHVRDRRLRTKRRSYAASQNRAPTRNASLIEQLGVLAILTGIWCANGCHMTDTVTSGAVFLGFLHAQLSFDVAESSDDPRATATRSNLRFLFMAKEGLWFIAFMAVQSWPLVFGSLLFSCYPIIRSHLRRTTRDGGRLIRGLKTTTRRRGAREPTANRRGAPAHPKAPQHRARSLHGYGAGLPARGNARSPSASPQ